MTPIRTRSARRSALVAAAGLIALVGSGPAAAQSPTLTAPGLGTLTMATSARSDSTRLKSREFSIVKASLNARRAGPIRGEGMPVNAFT